MRQAYDVEGAEAFSMSEVGSIEEVQMMPSGKYNRCHPGLRLVATLAALLACAVAWSPSVGAAAAAQKRFASAEDGVQALIAAAKAGDLKSMLDVLGPAARPLITSGDPVVDRNDRERLAKAYEESHSLIMAGERKAVLQVGKDDWPFPIPLVKDADGWRFDTRAGKEEILNILKAQGPDAPGGAYDYVVNGKMIGGFALVAYPASWGN
jgi:hypothetical protein